MTGVATHHSPIHHYCHARASPPSHDARYDQQASLTGVVRGLGSIVPVHLALLKTCEPRYDLSWPRVVLRCSHVLSNIMSVCRHARSGWGQRGPHLGACAFVQGRTHAQGIGRGRANAQGAKRGGARTQGVGQGRACSQGIGQGEARAQGIRRDGVHALGVERGRAHAQRVGQIENFLGRVR
jgi:hypothetical protein